MTTVVLCDAAAPQQRKRQIVAARRQCLVALADAPVAEQRLIRTATRRVGGEQHQPRRAAINTVQRHQLRVAQPPRQPRQQGFFHIATRGRHRQEVRLVGHQQMLILDRKSVV